MTDIASIVFPYFVEEDTELPSFPARIFHDALLKWLSCDYPDLVKRLYDANYNRPYTISDLNGYFKRAGKRIYIRKGELVWYRLTSMESNFIACVLESAARQKTGPKLDDIHLAPRALITNEEEHPWARLSSFKYILEHIIEKSKQHPLSYSVTLSFVTPTCFIENKQALPLPIPRYVFGFLVNKWQLFSPVPLPIEDVQHFVESIHLVDQVIESVVVDLKKYRRTGFFGQACFGIHPALPQLYRQALHLLSEFAFFSGTGSHTTMGMGQVRPLHVDAIEYHSCFISYSSKDEEFAKKLYIDLRNNGVKCWFAPEDMKIGDKIRLTIDRAIPTYDKLLIILSENSINSDWVEHEVEVALQKEIEQKRVVLFPIRLDDAVIESTLGWTGKIRRERNIGDFKEWKNHDSYIKVFKRLLKDLKADEREYKV